MTVSLGEGSGLIPTCPWRRLRARTPAWGLAALLLLPPTGLEGQQPLDSTSIPALERALEVLRAEGRDGELARVYRRLGAAWQAQDEEARAAEAFRTGLAHATSADDLPALAELHNSLGLHHWSASRYDSALVHLREAQALWSTLGDREGLSRVWNNLGVTHYQSANYEPALEAFYRSLELRRELGNRLGEVLVLSNIGKAYHDWQQFERALPVMEEAVALAFEVGHPLNEGYALHVLGMLLLDLGRTAEARDVLERSLALYDSNDPRITRSDSLSGRALNLLGLGHLALLEGDPLRAVEILETVRAEAEEQGHLRRQASALVLLGRAYRAQGELSASVGALRRSLELSRASAQRTLALQALAELSRTDEAAGRIAAALEHLRAHNALRDSIFDQNAARRIAATEGRLITERQELENARLREEQRIQQEVIARQRAVGLLGGTLLVLSLVFIGVLVRFNRIGREQRRLLRNANAALEGANRELREALAEVRTLKGLIPICAHCKKVRDDRGFWEAVETYIADRSDALFSHSICMECGPRIYGQDWEPLDDSSGVGEGGGEVAGPGGRSVEG